MAIARDFIQETATALDVSSSVTADVVLAANEAITNIIVHGYQDQTGMIEIEVKREADVLLVRLRDQAPPFDPLTVPPPDLSLPLEKRPIGGMGIYMIRQLMDKVIHRGTPQGGNELTLIKHIIRGEDK
ncbi:MAG: ATP-binding protein [Anaerolineae bacterium]|nr:ATP-binding protein [Anaerolineae bacterium]